MSNIMTQNPYIPRFEDMLKPLQSKLSKLEIKLDSIDDNHPDKQQSTLNVLEEINKTKQNIKNTEKNLECAKDMSIIRSNKIPKDIQDHNVWNDCWYDEERKLYVTFNEYFVKAQYVWDRPHQKQYSEETGIEAVIILPEQVEFRFGFPAIIQDDLEEQDTWFLIPTLTDEMLTNEIVKSRLRPKSDKKSILYRTQSEQWITIGTKGLKLCEKENEISDKLQLYPIVPLEELKTLYGRS